MHTDEDYGSAGEEAVFGNLIRNGTVVDRRNGLYGPEVMVSYPDRGVTSTWLSVGQLGAAGAAFHFCPRIGDNVTTLHFPTGVEQGIVIAANATANNPSFVPNSIDALAVATENGAYFEHEPQSGTLTVAGVASFHLSINGDVISYNGGTWHLTVGGDLQAQVGGAANITANGSATIKAPAITLDGPVTVTKTLTVGGNVTFEGQGTIAAHLQNLDGAGGGA
jgi:phage baseplate assembly protein gpV